MPALNSVERVDCSVAVRWRVVITWRDGTVVSGVPSRCRPTAQQPPPSRPGPTLLREYYFWLIFMYVTCDIRTAGSDVNRFLFGVDVGVLDNEAPAGPHTHIDADQAGPHTGCYPPIVLCSTVTSPLHVKYLLAISKGVWLVQMSKTATSSRGQSSRTLYFANSSRKRTSSEQLSK